MARVPTDIRDLQEAESSIQQRYNEGSGAYGHTASRDETSDVKASRGAQSEYETNPSDNPNENQKSVEEAEKNPSDGYVNNWLNNRKPSKKVTSKLFKKSAPIGIIVALLLGLGGLASFFGGPGLLIVNIAETIESKMNFQLPGMTTANRKILSAKVKNTTTGVCTSAVSLRCKFATFSKKEVENFKKAGIEIVPDGKTVITGRTKAAIFKWEGQEISPNDFNKLYDAPDGRFRTAVNRAHSPKLAGTSDKIFSKILGKAKTSKKAPFDEADTTDEARSKKMKQTTKEGTSTPVNGPGEEPKDCDSKCQKQRGEQKNVSENVNNLAKEVGESGEKVSTKLTSSLTTSGLKSATNFVKVTGPVDSACSAYGLLRGTTIAIKVVRRAQMIRYAMQFLVTSSMIKAGKAKPDDVSYLGNILTKIVQTNKTENGKTTQTLSKAATDSSFYLNAMDSRNNTINDNATQWMAGGGLGGQLESVTGTVLGLLGGSKGSADKTCGVVNNPVIQVASLVAGIALLFVPGGPAIKAAQVAGQLSITAALFAAEVFLPGMIADIINGNLIDDSTFGESSGNIIVAGSTSLMTASAQAGGTPLLKKSQSQRIAHQQEKVRQEYLALERANVSPFDIASPSSAMGSIYGQLMPYVYRGRASVSHAFSSVGSLVSSSFTKLTPHSFAAGEDAYGGCQDLDLNDLGISCTPAGVETRGIDTRYMDDVDPVFDRLRDGGHIDAETDAPKSREFKRLIEQCVERDRPIGLTDPDNGDSTNGAECTIEYPEDKAPRGSGTLAPLDKANREKLDMFQYLIYQRTLDGREEEYPDESQVGSAAPTGNGTVQGDIAWPLDKALFDKNQSDWLGAHTASSGTFTASGTAIATDISAGATPGKTPVYSMFAGKVEKRICASGASSGGMIVESDVAGGKIRVAYAHTSGQTVSPGDTVTAGQQIAVLDGIGCRVFGAHLHIDMAFNGQAICPQDVFIAMRDGQKPDFAALTSRAASHCGGRK